MDFDLRYLHPFQTDAGLGTPAEFLGRDLPADQKHSRSAFLDRYLAATVGFGHAGYLPEVEEWGLPAVVKTYYLLRKLQTYYLGNPVESIHYHYSGNLLETTEALISGAFEHSQVQITYANGLRIWVNAGAEAEWVIEHAETSFTLPPASFVARASDEFLAYSADAGSGRMDYAACPEYFYCDTRGVRTKMGPITLDGAALVLERKWQIDVYPMDCTGEIEVRPDYYWSQKRLPPLRLLAFKPDENEPQNVPHKASGEGVSFQPTQDAYMYRIALPEWMVEPGQ